MGAALSLISNPLAAASWLPLAAEGAGGGLSGFMPIIIIIAIFYFIVIRPASRERKNREAQVSALVKHDKVITNAGIHGTVVGLTDENVILRVDDKNNVRMTFSRAAIWQVLGDEDASEKSAKTDEDTPEEDASTGGKSKGKRKASAAG